jgi:hypothetical protein
LLASMVDQLQNKSMLKELSRLVGKKKNPEAYEKKYG